MPALIPFAIPDELPIVATPVALLLHVPPEVTSLIVIDDPTHTDDGPAIAAAVAALTVTAAVLLQPAPTV